MNRKTDVVIVGTGAAGLFCALKLPVEYQILMITKDDVDQSDSFLAQGGMCMLRGEEDYNSYFEDTMKAGHYENNKASVDVMIRSSNQIAEDLLGYGVDFERNGDELAFTREGGRVSCFMKISPARRLQASFLREHRRETILRYWIIR